MSTLPKPVMPTQQVAAYQNRALSGIGQGQLTASPDVQMPASMASRPSQVPLTIAGRTSMISQGATDAGNARLAALQRRTQSIQSPSTQTASQSVSGASGARSGPYGFTPAAERAYEALNAAYQKQFGTSLTVNSGGRSYAQQAQAYQNYLNGGNLALPPGHSVHETGNAADFGGAILNAGSPEHQWLVANGARYGWVWAGKNFSQVEPWHFEYRG